MARLRLSRNCQVRENRTGIIWGRFNPTRSEALGNYSAALGSSNLRFSSDRFATQKSPESSDPGPTSRWSERSDCRSARPRCRPLRVGHPLRSSNLRFSSDRFATQKSPESSDPGPTSRWSERSDSNRRQSRWQREALPLSYARLNLGKATITRRVNVSRQEKAKNLSCSMGHWKPLIRF